MSLTPGCADSIPAGVTRFPFSPASCGAQFAAFAEKLRGLKGKRRIGVAIGFGLIGAAAFPPLNFAPVFWLCFPALVFLLQGARNWKQAFFIGWAFSFGLLTLGLYWIAASMFVDIAKFWWAVPLSVFGLPAMFSIYYGFWMAVAWRLGTRGFTGVLTAALGWFLADVTRGNMFSGFPWNLEGYAWSGILPMLQITSVIGIYGLTLLTLVAAFLPALLVEDEKYKKRLMLASLAVLLLIGFWGEGRLAGATEANVAGVRLRLVQPNTDQKHKWDENRREPDFAQLIHDTSAPGEKPVTHVIWPETAATYYLAEDPAHRAMIAEHLPVGGALITGVVRRSLDELGQMQYHNSLIAIDSYGDVATEYDKHHLVPFGEYIPYRSVFPLRPLIHLGVDFTPGDRPYTLHIPGFPPFSPLICYEAIFPDEVTAADDRPQLLINVTNDGWYGDTAGPYQHFAMARVRAIEQGLPLARAANTGISGVVDAYGRVRARIPLGMAGYTDADLPAALPPTFFGRWRDVPFWALFGAFALSIIVASRRSVQSGRKKRRRKN